MSTSLTPLKIRQRLGREQWGIPEEFGPDGWRFHHFDEPGSIIVTCASHDTDDRPGGLSTALEIVHASMAFRHRDPTYLEMAALHRAVWPDGYAYMSFVPPEFHVNLHPHALHLWGRLDGRSMLPEFSALAPFGRSI